MKKKASLKNDKEAAEALVSKTADESDVDEEQQIADLSAVPTPKIGFKMPKLGGETEEKKEEEVQKKRPLTANLLNNQIVNMRKVVEKATFFLQGEMKKKLKFLEKKNEKKANPKEQKRMEKMRVELKAMETLNKDEVVKYALVSKTPKKQLDFSGTKPVAERCLYHLATSKPVQKEVNKFRETYPDWETRTAYFLQRLGKQYQEAKASQLEKQAEKKTKTEKKSLKKEEKEEVESDAEPGDEGEFDPENEDISGDESEEEGEISDVEMGSSSEDEETIANRRNLLLGLCGIKEDKSRPKIAPKPKKRPAESEDEGEEEEGGPAEVKTDNSVKELLKKTIETQASRAKKGQRKLAAELRGEKEKTVKKTVKTTKEPTTTGSVVKRVKLSEGGLVDLQKPATGPEEDSEDDDDDEEEQSKPVSSFFLNPNSKGRGESSGEESVDDDEDFAAVPLRKKGPREMSKGRIKLQEKIERRGEDRHQKLQSQKKAIFESKRQQAKKPAPNPQNPETLHPSWAARVQKKQQLGQVQPQGKRVVFDD